MSIPFRQGDEAAVESLIPQGKTGRPEDIATVTVDSSFVSGVELSVDGGFSAI